MSRNKLDLEMSTLLLKGKSNAKAKLEIDEETSFDIFYEVYNIQQTEYFYIKLVENSAVAPFYYNRSYTIEELHELDKIFMATNMQDLNTKHFKDLFEQGKVKLSYADDNKEIVKMEFKVSLFVESYIVEFELYKEMIPENEKDDKLIQLYNIDKNQLKIAKEMMKFLKANHINLDQNLLDEYLANFDLSGESYDDNNINNNINYQYVNPPSPQNNQEENLKLIEPELDDEELRANFNKMKKGINVKDEEGYKIGITFENKTSIPWDIDSIKFQIDENNSQILCEKIIYPIFTIDIGYSGDFYFLFNKNTKPGKYKCKFYVFFKGKKIKDTLLQLKLKIKEEEE